MMLPNEDFNSHLQKSKARILAFDLLCAEFTVFMCRLICVDDIVQFADRFLNENKLVEDVNKVNFIKNIFIVWSVCIQDLEIASVSGRFDVNSAGLNDKSGLIYDLRNVIKFLINHEGANFVENMVNDIPSEYGFFMHLIRNISMAALENKDYTQESDFKTMMDKIVYSDLGVYLENFPWQSSR